MKVISDALFTPAARGFRGMLGAGDYERFKETEMAVNSGLHALAVFAGSFPGLALMAIGQTMVVVCLVFDMVRVLSVIGSHRRYVAATVFRTLALPAIIATAIGVLISAASWAWMDVAFGTFIMVALIFRWHHQTDEDNWWKGKGKKLARWARKLMSSRLVPSPAAS